MIINICKEWRQWSDSGKLTGKRKETSHLHLNQDISNTQIQPI